MCTRHAQEHTGNPYAFLSPNSTVPPGLPRSHSLPCSPPQPASLASELCLQATQPVSTAFSELTHQPCGEVQASQPLFLLTLEHSAHPAHPLCYSLSVYDGSFNCDLCERDRNGPAYHCDFCRFDICIACALDVVLTTKDSRPCDTTTSTTNSASVFSHAPPAVSDLTRWTRSKTTRIHSAIHKYMFANRDTCTMMAVFQHLIDVHLLQGTPQSLPDWTKKLIREYVAGVLQERKM